MNNKLTLDQQRARYAWRNAEEAAGVDTISDYSNLVKTVATLIMGSGLMQTFAFLKSKTKTGEETEQHALLIKHLCKWLGQTLGGREVSSGKLFPGEAQADFESVMNALYEGDSALYRRASSETMALLRWSRQLSSAQKAVGGKS